MPKRPAAIHISRRFPAPPERVFRAWIDPAIAGRWLFATATQPMTRVAIDPRVDGSFLLAHRHHGTSLAYSGRYLEIVPPRRLAFTVAAEHQPGTETRVSVEFVPRGAGCDVNVVNEGVPPAHAEHAEGRWTGLLYGLGVTLDKTSSAKSVRAAQRRSKR